MANTGTPKTRYNIASSTRISRAVVLKWLLRGEKSGSSRLGCGTATFGNITANYEKSDCENYCN
jgi:hypothetical protein